MQVPDVEVYSYVTDDGVQIQVSVAVSGDPGKDRRASASIYVDGVERLHADTHFVLPKGVPLGEWFVKAVVNCLCRHMIGWCEYHIFNNLLSMATADDPQPLPTDDRHITELTEAQSEWWSDNLEISQYLDSRTRELADQMAEKYPQLRGGEQEDGTSID